MNNIEYKAIQNTLAYSIQIFYRKGTYPECGYPVDCPHD